MPDTNEPTSQARPPIQEMMGKNIAKMVMWGTITIGIVGVAFAIVALALNNDVKEAFSIIQYVFGALLPLWGTWIGTVLAYYYSKANFESANNSVRQMVDKLTSEKKLESVKAVDVMIPLDKLIYQEMKAGETLAKFNLKTDCLDFLEKNKIKRLIILNDKKQALYSIHRDMISYFIASQILAGNAVTDFTLEDMYTKGSPEIKNILDNSVKFISKDANLLEAKHIMQQFKTCQDVFVTGTGKSDETILGWITNVTITENSIV
jgi:hypothetical protein